MTEPVDLDDDFGGDIDPAFAPWRTAHKAASVVLALLALVHLGFTPMATQLTSPDALWFAGTGLALLLLAVLNFSHIGLGPCEMPSARLVRLTNWVFFAFALWALIVVRELPAIIGLVAIGTMAICSLVTLRGRRR